MFNSWYKHGAGKNWFKNLEYSLCITLNSKVFDLTLKKKPSTRWRNELRMWPICKNYYASLVRKIALYIYK